MYVYTRLPGKQTKPSPLNFIQYGLGRVCPIAVNNITPEYLEETGGPRVESIRSKSPPDILVDKNEKRKATMGYKEDWRN